RDDYIAEKIAAEAKQYPERDDQSWRNQLFVHFGQKFWRERPDLKGEFDRAFATAHFDNPADQQNLRFQAYKRLAGETEARNVQRRMFDRPEQLREPGNEPWRSQDIPTKEQIVRPAEERQLRLPGLATDAGPLGPGAALPKSATELVPGLKVGAALEQNKGKPGLISQRAPTAQAGRDPHGEGAPLVIGLDAMRH